MHANVPKIKTLYNIDSHLRNLFNLKDQKDQESAESSAVDSKMQKNISYNTRNLRKKVLTAATLCFMLKMT